MSEYIYAVVVHVCPPSLVAAIILFLWRRALKRWCPWWPMGKRTIPKGPEGQKQFKQLVNLMSDVQVWIVNSDANLPEEICSEIHGITYTLGDMQAFFDLDSDNTSIQLKAIHKLSQIQNPELAHRALLVLKGRHVQPSTDTHLKHAIQLGIQSLEERHVAEPGEIINALAHLAGLKATKDATAAILLLTRMRARPSLPPGIIKALDDSLAQLRKV